MASMCKPVIEVSMSVMWRFTLRVNVRSDVDTLPREVYCRTTAVESLVRRGEDEIDDPGLDFSRKESKDCMFVCLGAHGCVWVMCVCVCVCV